MGLWEASQSCSGMIKTACSAAQRGVRAICPCIQSKKVFWSHKAAYDFHQASPLMEEIIRLVL